MMVLLTLPNILIISLTLLFIFLFRRMKQLQRNAEQIPHGDAQSRETRHSHHAEHKPGRHPVAIAGKLHARPVVMAAIQEAKTEVMEHFVKKKFKDPKQKELPHLTAS